MGYPPRNGPAPFYVVGAEAPPHAQQEPQAYPERDPTPRIPSSSKPAPIQTGSPPPTQYGMQPQTGHRPQSTYANPVELGTTAYESPSGHQPHSAYSSSVYSEDPYSATIPSNQQLPPGQQSYAAYVPPQQAQQSAYEQPGPASQQPPPSQQRYNAYIPPQQPQQQQQPTYEPPDVPAGRVPSPVPMNAGYPVINHDARNTLPSQGQYKPYQRPGSAGRRPSGGASSGAADFYRQSAAY
jgi:signal transducing adaptor molecule